jgi:hypothetical protein
MSFEIYLQVFNEGGESGFTSKELRAAFAGHFTEVEADFWQVHFSDADTSDMFLTPASDGTPTIHSISVHRPSNDDRLWHALYALLQANGSIFYFPGCAAPLTRDPKASDSMPKEMLEELGQPQMVESPADLLRAVESA